MICQHQHYQSPGTWTKNLQKGKGKTTAITSSDAMPVLGIELELVPGVSKNYQSAISILEGLNSGGLRKHFVRNVICSCYTDNKC